MANPQTIPTPAGVWTKVATSVLTGLIHRLTTSSTYSQTYRLTGEAAPTDKAEGVPLFVSQGTAQISAADPIDVYIWAEGRDGSVRVDI